MAIIMPVRRFALALGPSHETVGYWGKSVGEPEPHSVPMTLKREAHRLLQLVHASEPAAFHILTTPRFAHDASSVVGRIIEVDHKLHAVGRREWGDGSVHR